MARTNVNAWLFLLEDEPPHTSYKTAGSCYQSLIANGVYRSVDIVSLCWVNTIQQADHGPTIALQESTHPDGSTNLDYLQWIVEDARAVNPDIKAVVMLGYGATEISQVFHGDETLWPGQAAVYAANIVAYLKQYGLDGLDVDWEPPLSESTTQRQYELAFTAIGDAFSRQSPPLLLMIAPSVPDNMDPATTKKWFSWVTPQLYGGAQISDFEDMGDRFGYGAKFETESGVPYQDAAQVHQAFEQESVFTSIMQWRLNSGDYEFEQAQQMILSQLVNGIAGPTFDDTPIVNAAGNPVIQSLTVRSGEVVDAIQACNQGTVYQSEVSYPLLRHGGDSGQSQSITIDPGDAVTEVSGYTGTWFSNQCVLQLTVTTRNGCKFGPFGTMANASTKVPFSFTAPSGQSIVAFRGQTVSVVLAGGERTDVIATLDVSYG